MFSRNLRTRQSVWCECVSECLCGAYMLGQAVVVATEAEDEVAGLSDVDAVSDVLEEEGEAFPSGQRRHVALGQSQMSAEEGEKEKESCECFRLRR